MENIQKANLLKEFNKLQTIDEKLNFWSTRLPVNYITYWEMGSERVELFNDLRPFDFKVEEHDRIKFANWILDNYHELSTKPKSFESLLNFDLLKNSFETKLETSKDKLETIRKELRLIRKEVKPPIFSDSQSLNSRLTSLANSFNKFNADFATFQDYKEEKLPPNFTEVHPHINSIIRAQNGFTVGKFWKYLEQLEKNIEGNINPKEAILSEQIEELQNQIQAGNKRTLQKSAQMLLLFHLGFFKNIINMDIQIKQKAKLIGGLLNIGSENIEKNLGKLGRGTSDYEKEKNYQELIDYLYNIGLNQLAKDINGKKKITS